MDFRRKKRASVDIGLIPMIDVLLVLLFFFMVATTFRNHTDLKIELPEASGSEIEQQGKSVNLFIDAKGNYSLGDEDGQPQPLAKQDLPSLRAALQRVTPASRQLPFIISADGKTDHQAVISAMDIANQVGFHHLTFAINTPQP